VKTLAPARKVDREPAVPSAAGKARPHGRGSACNHRQHIAGNQADAAQAEQHQRPRGKGHLTQEGHKEPAGGCAQGPAHAAHHEHQEDENEHERHEVFRTGCSRPDRRPGGGLELAPHDLGQCNHAVQHPLIDPARPELGHDPIADDPPGREVRQPAFQAVHHLDPDLAVVPGNNEDNAVVEALAADLPALGHANGKIFQRIPIQRGDG
jgi:hypothetical protein